MAQPRPEDLAVHAEFLRRLARRLLRSPDLADDAVQETLTLAWQKQPAVERLRGWLAGTLRNVARNQRRADSRRQARHSARGPRAAASPEAIREREATRRHLLRAVLALPDASRDVVLLRYEQGLSPKRIAAELEIPVHTVHNRLRSGLSRLRAMLQHEFEGRGDPRDWRAALGALVPSLPLAGSSGAALGGSLVLKKTLAAAAVLIVLLGGWWAIHQMTDDAPSVPTPPTTADHVDATPEPAPALALHAGADDATPPRDVPTADVAMIHGRVVSAADQTPIAGARVRVLGYVGLVELSATTDDDGYFRLDETQRRRGAFHLVVHAQGFARRSVARALPSTRGLVIELRAGGWITGKVVDHDGTTKADVRVRSVLRMTDVFDEDPRQKIVLRALPRSIEPHAIASVDPATGTFRLGPLRAGQHALELLVSQRAPMQRVPPGSEPSWERGFTVEDGQTLDVGTLSLPRYKELALRVVDGATDRLLERVSFAGLSNPSFAAARFPLEVLGRTESGAYRLPVAVDERGGISLDVEIQSEGYARKLYDISGTAVRGEQLVRLYSDATLTVTVHREDGTSAIGSVAYVRRGMDHAVLAVRTVAQGDEGGVFSVTGLPPAEEIEVFVFDPAMDRQISMTQLTLKAGEHRHVTLGGTERGAIRGVVRIQGKPLVRTFVTVDDPSRGRRQVWTGHDGYFRFDDLEEGTHRVYLNMGEHRAMLDREFEVRHGAVVDASIDMRHQVTGRVRIVGTLPKGTDDEPPDLMLRAGDPKTEGFEVSVRPAKDGTFTTYVPRADTYQIASAFADFYVPQGAKVKVVGPSTNAGEIVVHPDPSDAVVLIRPVERGTGAPVSGASASFSAWQSTGGLLGTTDGVLRDGDCRLGPRRYTVSAPGFVSTTITVHVVPNRKLEARTVELRRSNSVRVTNFSPESRAEKAGVLVDDVIWSYADARIKDFTSLAAAIRKSAPNDIVRIVVLRDGQRVTLDVPGGRMGIYVATAFVDED